jgi:hypothetical protein
MKIRTDFVTNSSSSSFAVFGMSLKKAMDNASDKKIVALYEKYADDDTAETDDEKIEYMRESGFDDPDGFDIAQYEGDDYDIGISITRLMEKYPANCLANINQIVADEFNDVFGTKFTERDISYIEEIVYG